MATALLVSVIAMCFLVDVSHSLTFSFKLIHRFSDEAKAVKVAKHGEVSIRWPRHRTVEYYKTLLRSDLQRQSMKLRARYPPLFPSEGSETFFPGNDMGWLHYTWVDIGTPNVSFFVALDTGSDLSWVPCDCEECAPLSDRYYNLDRDLGVYSPSKSSTSKHLPCNHHLCELGPNCKSSKLPCPYRVDYVSQNTSTSGVLVEDLLHLASSSVQSSAPTVKTSIIIGCGRKQTGGYVSGIAPDGLLGMGFGAISVPSFLAKAGLVRDSFSLCFKEDASGRIFFGDQGLSKQLSTPFLTVEGKHLTYIVGVENVCIGSVCQKQKNFRVLVDSGSSFTHLPNDVYEKVTMEFDKQMNTSKISYEDSTWDCCYNISSLDLAQVPTLSLTLVGNNSFIVQNPFLPLYLIEGQSDVLCLAFQPTEDEVGTIGQDFMTGYRMVFDRENLKLGWSRSNCHDSSGSPRVPLTPPTLGRPENPLPTSEQQSSPGGRAVSPAEASRTPANPSAAVSLFASLRFQFQTPLLLYLALLHV
ncbi:aspartic proteinase-like protein 1 [Aristolochia californica]|uniref:aspartic proteinase-like protein 1 n=1 Tax=Aristolochia californica TaxID=171875 RepID=UPI0035E28C7B